MAKENILFLVSEDGWGYDDNNYHSQEGGYGRIAFRTMKGAKKCKEQYDLEAFITNFSNGDIRDYHYELADILDISRVSNDKIFEKYFQCTPEKWYDDRTVDWVVKPTTQMWKKLYSYFHISWHSIQEIEVGEV